MANSKTSQVTEATGYMQQIQECCRLAETYQQCGNLQQARDEYIKVILLCKKHDYKKGVAACFMQLGLISEIRGTYKTSLYLFEKSIKLSTEISDFNGVAQAHNLIGLIRFLLGDINVAEGQYRLALNISTNNNNKGQVATNLGSLAEVYIARGQLSEAQKHCDEALEICKTTKDNECIADQYNRLGKIYYAYGDFSKSIKLVQQALDIAIKHKSKARTALQYGTMGWLYQSQDINKSKDYYERALELYIESRHRVGHASTVGVLGQLYIILGDFEKALQFLEQALNIFEEIKVEREVGHLYNLIGEIFVKKMNEKAAHIAYEKGLYYNTVWENQQGIAFAYLGIGNVSSMQADKVQALWAWVQARNIFRKLNMLEQANLVQAAISKL